MHKNHFHFICPKLSNYIYICNIVVRKQLIIILSGFNSLVGNQICPEKKDYIVESCELPSKSAGQKKGNLSCYNRYIYIYIGNLYYYTRMHN